MRKGKYIIAIITIVFLAAAIAWCFANERASHIEQGMVYKETHSYFEDVSLKGTADILQEVKLVKADENVFYAFVPGEIQGDIRVYYTKFEELLIDGKSYDSGDVLKNIREIEKCTLTAKGWDGSTESAEVEFCFAQDIPTIYVKSDSGSLQHVNADRSIKEPAKLTTIDAEGEKNSNLKCDIKSRGNSSYRDVEQKSYNIKLDTAQSLLGLDAAEEWSLLANYREDVQQLKNKIALDIAERLGMEYTPDSCFVNLYIDGQYNGLYLLTQRISVDGGSVKIHDLEAENEKAEALNTVPENMSGGYLLELDIRAPQEETWFATERKTIRVKSPEGALEDELTYIMYYMKKVEYILYSDEGINTDTGESYMDCMDLESWIDMYLIREFFVEWDTEFSSLYMYKEIDDPLIYAGPVWDFDLAYGSVWYGNYPKLTSRTLFMKDYKKGWLNQLDSHSEFHQLMFEEYKNTFVPVIEEYFSEEYHVLAGSLQLSMDMNAKRWGREATDVQKETSELYAWIMDRKSFFDEYTDDEDALTKVIFHFEWGLLSYYVKTGEALNYLPKEIYGQIDERAAAEYAYGNVIGWQDENGIPVTEDTVITKEREFYAVYAEN